MVEETNKKTSATKRPLSVSQWFKFFWRRGEETCTTQDKRKKKFVAVIGAGSSGLAATKSLLEEGHSVVCFEQYDRIGGNWAYSEEPDVSSIYETSVIFTTKENMCYSDFPVQSDLPHYLHHSDVLEYLNNYCDHFKLADYIKFKTKVTKVIPNGDGTWSLTYETGKQTETRIFDAVMVCNGHHRIPKHPVFEGADEFTKGGGMILHSHSYNKAKPYAGKHVVIVGVGNSGCDLGVDISQVAEATYLSTRHGVYVIPKFYWGIPTDHLFLTRFFHSLPKMLGQMIFRTLTYIIQGSMKNYGLDPKIKKFSHPTRNSDILPLIKSGKLKVKGNIKTLVKNGVVFEDGTQVKADVVIYATGYRIAFPFLDNDVFCVTKRNEVRLYKFCVSPDPKLKNLFFIGLVQPIGALMPISELQSRWISRLLAEEVSLPSQEAMEKDIQKKRESIQTEFHKSTRHTIQVDYISFMDELAKLIGVKPKIYKHLNIFWQLIFGVMTPVQYRLDGPGKMPNAANVIKDLCQYKKEVAPISPKLALFMPNAEV